MPSLGFGEILVILVVALIVFGPRRLPEMGRTIGKGLREFRRAASDLRTEIEDDFEDDEGRPNTPAPSAHRREGDGKAGERAPDRDPESPQKDPGAT